ncbi:efflux transporter outer membrane subunit [Pedobacter sp. SYSU D00535]|uniref:efflux transporter outer membrane subunit n=1 Tax=Pedobacter sp. SYSU D00535 TaxID=2810308 RepID=UPI001A961FB6|nr:TolC family protein [Pedobacter sp. SYSU D00535]
MNTRTYINRALLFGGLLLLVASCRIGKNYQRPDLNTENLYRDVNSTDTTNIGAMQWSQVFGDALLQELIREGLEKNLDLKIAYTRIEQSEAYFRQSRAAFLPSVNANASATVNRLSNAQGRQFLNNTRIYQLGLSSSWEADIWGRLRSSKRASLATLLGSEAYARAVKTSIVSGVANYYYQLLALDQQLAITEQTVKNWTEIVETMKTLKEAALVTGAAVVQSEASRYAAEVTIPDLRLRIRETENALNILLGRNPGAVRRNRLSEQTLPSQLEVGVPAQLLALRPDVQQAEYNFRYFFENTNVARSYFYPALTITANGGFSNIALTDFFSSNSVFGNLVGGLAQPIFNRRINKTRLEVARAQQTEALLNFERSLLNAGQEVSDALASFEASKEKTTTRTNQLAALQKSVEFSQELLKYGRSNYTEVLNARQSLLGAELARVNDQLQGLQSMVELYRSLGGGWK